MPELQPISDEDDVGEVLDGIDHIERLAWWATKFVNSVCAILAIFFTWLQLRNYQIAQIIEYARPEFLLKLTMIGFYTCWLFGPTFDIKVQKLAYVKDPYRGKLGSIGFSLLILFSISALFLLWASDNEQNFFIALSAFMTLNIISYVYIFYRMRPAASESELFFYKKKNYRRFLQAKEVTHYMFGNWQRYRFLFVALGICLLDALCFSSSLRNYLGESVHRIVPSVQAQSVAMLLPDIALLVFLTISEGWIWTQRLIVKISLATIAKINEQYRLEPRN